jgi:rhodanese-related sulfurtransferase
MKSHFLFLIATSMLFADAEVGCSISGLLHASNKGVFAEKKENTCSQSEKKDIPVIGKTTAITPHLRSVKVLHDKEEVLIERKLLHKHLTCPPFCIEPMKIKGVETLGELEVLAFIDKLKEKKGRLLIDVRENALYEKETIPGAINLPLSMLQDGSRYQGEVLRLLGAKLRKSNAKWSFKKAQRLLIFGDSATTPEASSALKKLLDLGYPSNKLYYYRGGLSAWKALGLTTYY